MNDEAKTPDPFADLRAAVNQSGIPFQLRVERLIHGISDRFSVYDIMREVPTKERFVDVVCRIGTNLIVIECKRTRDRKWVLS